MSASGRTVTMTAMLAFAASMATGATIDLDALMHQCSMNTQINGIDETDVTGNMGGSTDCWGAEDGNDPGPGGGFETNDMVFNYLAKWDDTDPLDDPFNIGLSQTGIGSTSGTWEFTNGALGSPFMIVLKAASMPGYGVWLFDGAHSASTEGTWSVAWGRDLSHLTVYVKDDFPTLPPVRDMPEPGTLALLGAGLLGAGWLRRRRRS